LISDANHWKTILPEQLDLITYPYEWCFNQWKQAALLTLEIMKQSMQHGMILKDATPFNIQFRGCRPVFIDSLSFDHYDEKQPWIAYRQFCESFLAPLAIMHYIDSSLYKLLMVYPEGIPLDVAAKMLPLRAKFNTGLLMHVFLQASVSRKNINNKNYGQSFSANKLKAIIESLESTIHQLNPHAKKTKWNNYYSETVLSKEYVAEKEMVVHRLLSNLSPGCVLDIGGNDGHFSKIAAEYGKRVILVDSDEPSINKFFSNECVATKTVIDVIVADIASPSPSVGALLTERENLLARLKGDVVLALGIIHHLVITRHFSFTMVASLFASMGKMLILEVPLPGDEKVRLIGADIKDLEKKYSMELFQSAFAQFFEFKETVTLRTAERIIYLLARKN
jgi:hypothetical protein